MHIWIVTHHLGRLNSCTAAIQLPWSSSRTPVPLLITGFNSEFQAPWLWDEASISIACTVQLYKFSQWYFLRFTLPFRILFISKKEGIVTWRKYKDTAKWHSLASGLQCACHRPSFTFKYWTFFASSFDDEHIPDLHFEGGMLYYSGNKRNLP